MGVQHEQKKETKSAKINYALPGSYIHLQLYDFFERINRLISRGPHTGNHFLHPAN